MKDLIIPIFFAIVFFLLLRHELTKSSYTKRKQAIENKYGKGSILNEEMICPHCKSIGNVITKMVVIKKGISGSKATASILTSGLSLLVVGLSRKESKTQCYCRKCNNTWFF